jgi:leader peptidase (prepilin peptidase) / N-methyltransferase
MKPEPMIFIPVMLIGWLAGALVNYLSDVLPIRRRLVTPFCLHCQQPTDWLNYFVWPRQCKNCLIRRSLRTWIVEVAFVIACMAIWAAPPEKLGFFISLVWLCYFGVVIVIDIEHRLILHPVSWVGAVLGLATGVWLHGWLNTFIGGAVGFGIMYGFYWLGIGYVRFVARKKGQSIAEGDAFGFGDVNLSGVIGLLLGWPGILAGLVFAILFSGAFVLLYLGFMLVVRRYTPNMALPYGPFLAASALYLLFLR